MKVNKPVFLYHGSSNRNILEFEPREQTKRHPDEGPVVFASPEKKGAVSMLVPWDDSWVISGRFSDSKGESEKHFICRDEERFHKADNGGAIYILPSKSFSLETKFGGGKDEWTSKEPVKPIDKIEYESGLDAMLENGVNVYFVDGATFDAIKKSEDHGFKIINWLKPFKKVAA